MRTALCVPISLSDFVSLCRPLGPVPDDRKELARDRLIGRPGAPIFNPYNGTGQPPNAHAELGQPGKRPATDKPPDEAQGNRRPTASLLHQRDALAVASVPTRARWCGQP